MVAAQHAADALADDALGDARHALLEPPRARRRRAELTTMCLFDAVGGGRRRGATAARGGERETARAASDVDIATVPRSTVHQRGTAAPYSRRRRHQSFAAPGARAVRLTATTHTNINPSSPTAPSHRSSPPHPPFHAAPARGRCA